MNRRSFLTALAAGFVLDPERLLWRPGAKLISVPKPIRASFAPESESSSAQPLGTLPKMMARIELEDERGGFVAHAAPLGNLLDGEVIFVAHRPMRIVNVKIGWNCSFQYADFPVVRI